MGGGEAISSSKFELKLKLKMSLAISLSHRFSMIGKTYFSTYEKGLEICAGFKNSATKEIYFP